MAEIESPDRSNAPEVHTFGPLTLGSAETITLANGVRIHTMADADSEVCRIAVAIPGGNAEETPDGVIRIIAPALSEGTVRHSAGEIAGLLEDFGAWSGASLSTHHTVYNLSCLSRFLDDLLPLVREIVLEPAFDPEAMDNLKETLASRNEVDRHKVEWQASNAIKPIIYGRSNPLAVSVSPESIRAVTPSRLHEVHARRLDPGNTHIFLSGGVTSGMIRRVSEVFSAFGMEVGFPLGHLEFPSIDGERRVFTEMPDSLQSGIVMDLPLIGRDNPDFVALRTVIIALGGYFGSRLMLNIREEKGLTYGIGAALLGYKEKGFMSVSTQTATEYVERVEEETLKEIERLKDPASYSADEIYRLGLYIRSGLASGLDNALSRMDLWQSYTLAGATPGYFEEQDEFACHLSAEVLADTASRYLDTSRIVTSVAGRKIL